MAANQEWATDAEREGWEKRQSESGGGGGGGGGGGWKWTLNWSTIAPGILVGSCPRSPSDVDRLAAESGATAVLNLQSDLCFDALQIPFPSIRAQAVRRGLRLERVPIRDFDHGDQTAMLPVAVRTVNLLLHEGCSVYIHCTAGINRATLTALGYLTFVKGMDLDSALSIIRSARPIAHPYLDCWHSVTDRLLGGREEAQMAMAAEIYEERKSSGRAGDASSDWRDAQARMFTRTFERFLEVDQGVFREHKASLAAQQHLLQQQREHERQVLVSGVAGSPLSDPALASLRLQSQSMALEVKQARWRALRLQLEALQEEGRAVLLQRDLDDMGATEAPIGETEAPMGVMEAPAQVQPL